MQLLSLSALFGMKKQRRQYCTIDHQHCSISSLPSSLSLSHPISVTANVLETLTDKAWASYIQSHSLSNLCLIFSTGFIFGPGSSTLARSHCALSNGMKAIYKSEVIQMMSTMVTVQLVPMRRPDSPSQSGKAHQFGTNTTHGYGSEWTFCSTRDHASRIDNVIGEKSKYRTSIYLWFANGRE